MQFNGRNLWGVILGGSSGFGLASAKELAARGMNICIVHRDRRGSMARIEEEFAEIRKTGVKFQAFNADALSKEGRTKILDELQQTIGDGRVRVMLHSIAFGSLKLIAPRFKKSEGASSLNIPANSIPANSIPAVSILANALGIPTEKLQSTIDSAFRDGAGGLHSVATAPQYEDSLLLEEEEILNTIGAMGTSMLTWTQDLFRRGLFSPDARVLGLTSEGNEIAWLGYAAVSAAKASLEAVSRSIAKEFGPHGIRSNILQPGVTDTPALRLIPGSLQLSAKAEIRNPLGRLTTVEDVARVVALLSSDEAAWINGSLIRVDGGEKIAG